MVISDNYRNNIDSLSRETSIEIQVLKNTNIRLISENSIILGSFNYTSSIQDSDELPIGSVISDKITVSLKLGDGTLIHDTNINYTDLLTSELKPYFLLKVGDNFERIPLGLFIVDSIKEEKGQLDLTLGNQFLRLDRIYETNLTFPATINQIIEDIRVKYNLLTNNFTLTNGNMSILKKPNNITVRGILSNIATLNATCCIFDRNGKLDFKHIGYKRKIINKYNRFSYSLDRVPYRINSFKFGDNVTSNSLPQLDIGPVDLELGESDSLNALYTIALLSQPRPIYEFSIENLCDPSIEAGDVVEFFDKNGTRFELWVFTVEFKFKGASTISSKKIKEDKKATFAKRTSIYKEVIDRIKDSKDEILNQIETDQSHIEFAKLVSQSLGGYYIEKDGEVYIADNVDISAAKKIWKWGLGGFTYYENGLSSTPKTGIDANGTIISHIIHAGIINADIIKSGILQSKDGSVWINLNNGTFNFGNTITTTTESHVDELKEHITFDKGNLNIQGGEINISSHGGENTVIGGGTLKTGNIKTKGELILQNHTITSYEDGSTYISTNKWWGARSGG